MKGRTVPVQKEAHDFCVMLAYCITNIVNCEDLVKNAISMIRGQSYIPPGTAVHTVGASLSSIEHARHARKAAGEAHDFLRDACFTSYYCSDPDCMNQRASTHWQPESYVSFMRDTNSALIYLFFLLVPPAVYRYNTS